MDDKFKLLAVAADAIGTDRVDVSRRIELAVEKYPQSSVLSTGPGGDASGEQLCNKLLASLLR